MPRGPRPSTFSVVARDPDTDDVVAEFDVTAQVGTPAAVRYVEHGGILHYVLRRLLTEA